MTKRADIATLAANLLYMTNNLPDNAPDVVNWKEIARYLLIELDKVTGYKPHDGRGPG